MKKTRADRLFSVERGVFIALLCLVTGFPFLLTLSVSLETMSEVYASSPRLWPAVPQWRNYLDAMSSGSWGRYMYNSLLVTVLTTAISLVINSMSGFVFARIPFRGRRTLFALILLGMMVPPEVTVVSSRM